MDPDAANQYKQFNNVDVQETDDNEESDDFNRNSLKSQQKTYHLIPNHQSQPIYGCAPVVNQNSASSINCPDSIPIFNPPPNLMRAESTTSKALRALQLTINKATASIKGSIFMMCTSVVGVGCLTLPYAVRNAGLIMGMSLILLCPFLAYFTLDLLLISAEYLPAHLRGSGPQRDISYRTYVTYI